MRDVDDYIATLTAGIDALPISEQPIAACTGKVLAKSITALAPVPPWTNSAMDGYAVRASEVAQVSEQTPVCLPVSGDVAAGANPAPLPEGTAMRIMTGAAIPPGADAVVQVELTDQAAGAAPLPEQVKIYQPQRWGVISAALVKTPAWVSQFCRLEPAWKHLNWRPPSPLDTEP